MAGVSKRRDHHEIVAVILKAAIEGKMKSHIMLNARISYSQMNSYLDLLIEKGFLENMIVKRKRKIVTFYRTTEKGIEFLNRLESINRLWT